MGNYHRMNMSINKEDWESLKEIAMRRSTNISKITRTSLVRNAIKEIIESDHQYMRIQRLRDQHDRSLLEIMDEEEV